MSVDVMVGLQYGSEGKGKWIGVIAHEYDAHVRVGAPNAGHTVYHGGRPYKMRQVPCGWVNPDAALFIGSAGLVDPELLKLEIAQLPKGVAHRLKVDKNAGILLQEDKVHEESNEFNKFNGSTSEGCGSALARKILRKSGVVASMVEERSFREFVFDTKPDLWERHYSGQSILIEGTQGYGLCLSHGTYPYVTSRDVLASSLLSDVGFSPRSCERVFGVLRTYPIRVAGNSGPMGAKEIDWEEVARRAGFPPGAIEERTTVTNRVRRVSEFNWDMLKEACLANDPDGLLLSFIDYIDATLHGQSDLNVLRNNARAMEFIERVEDAADVPVIAVSTGPRPQDVIYRESWARFFKP